MFYHLKKNLHFLIVIITTSGSLIGLLTYKPWSSSEALEEFVASVPDSIPFPNNPNWINYAYCLGVTPQAGTNFNTFNRNKVIDFPPPELLDKSGNQKWRERLKVNFGIG